MNQTATETTCDYLLAQWGLTVSDFVALNDNVDDACDNLVIGQPVCIIILYDAAFIDALHTVLRHHDGVLPWKHRPILQHWLILKSVYSLRNKIYQFKIQISP